jgi:thioredoxin-like negative regulator of GroEL
MPAKKTSKAYSSQTGALSKALIFAGIVIILAVVFLLKNKPELKPELTEQAPETQMDWYLENQEPVFVFFHSTTCKSCTDMMAVVDDVYPEFNTQVGLVDVDVYQSMNDGLLRRARITSIPTQVFINEKGEGKMMIGGMQPDELRAELLALADGADRGD